MSVDLLREYGNLPPGSQINRDLFKLPNIDSQATVTPVPTTNIPAKDEGEYILTHEARFPVFHPGGKILTERSVSLISNNGFRDSWTREDVAQASGLQRKKGPNIESAEPPWTREWALAESVKLVPDTELDLQTGEVILFQQEPERTEIAA